MNAKEYSTVEAKSYSFDGKPGKPAIHQEEPRTVTVSVEEAPIEPQFVTVNVTHNGPVVPEKPKEVQLALRLTEELHAAVRDWAMREHRSLNKQIVHVLQAGVDTMKGKG